MGEELSDEPRVFPTVLPPRSTSLHSLSLTTVRYRSLRSVPLHHSPPHYAHYVRPNVRLAHRTNHTFGLTVRSLGSGW